MQQEVAVKYTGQKDIKQINKDIATSFFSIGNRDVVITQTISPCARLQPLSIEIHTHTLPIQNRYALTQARTPYAVLKPTKQY